MVNPAGVLRPRHRQRGITYLGLLFAVAVVGISLAGTGVVMQLEGRREREKELLFIGEEFRQAITSYYNMAINDGQHQYPRRLEDLLLDERSQIPVRHLRRIYRDPMSNTTNWELIRQPEGISGVASRSRDKPVKIAGFDPVQDGFESANSYADWHFDHAAGNAGAAATATATAAAAAAANPPGETVQPRQRVVR